MPSLIKRFMKSTSAAIAPMFALSASVLVVVGGIALDYVHASQIKSRLQAASDAAVLAAARAKSLDGSMNQAKLNKIARDFFDSNGGVQADNTITQFKLSEKNDVFSLEINTKQKTSLMQVAGYSEMDVGVTSFAEIGPGMPLEIVLVLDNTGSMSGAKLTALKDASKKLVGKVLDDPKARVKVALVPFSNYVNVGLGKRNNSWIDVPADYSTSSNSCWNTYPDKKVIECHKETRTRTNDGVSYSYEKNVCTYDYGDPVQKCSSYTRNYTWRGCVGSRDYPGNVNDDIYNFSKIPGLLNINCSKPVTALTKTQSDIIAGIDAMNASGSTYIPAGLAWGWRVLSHEKPFSEGKRYKQMKDEGGIKAVVLMTDGANTKSSTYPYHTGSDVALANQLTAELCTNIKAQKISIYTIAFEVTDSTIKNLLQQCATNTGMYFDAGSSSALTKAFDSIAGQLTQLRLTK